LNIISGKKDCGKKEKKNGYTHIKIPLPIKEKGRDTLITSLNHNELICSCGASPSAFFCAYAERSFCDASF